MKSLEMNKIVAGVLLAGLIAMFSGKIADALYHPETAPETRGFKVEVVDNSAGAAGQDVADVQIDIESLLSTATIEAGITQAKKCASCHSFDKDGANKTGPTLWNIVNTDKASNSNYNYSKTLSSLGGTWNNEDLYAFINNPRKFAKGTKMTFIGIKKPEDVANIIAYLGSLK